jgi:NTP pyrophosphatase (non-canonical NTP hydrolase)
VIEQTRLLSRPLLAQRPRQLHAGQLILTLGEQIMIEKLYRICEALQVRFPGTSDPFRILARLMEESGELAEQVHIREDTGRKRAIHGEPDDQALAKEIQDIMTAVLDIARHYGIQPTLEARVDAGYRRAVSEGLIEAISSD